MEHSTSVRAFDVPLMPKKRPRVVTIGGVNKPRRHMAYMPPDYVDWKAQIGLLVGTIPDQLGVRFRFELPASWSRSKQLAMIWQPHVVRPDLDNLVGALMDACKAKDQTIHQVVMSKVYAPTTGFDVWDVTIDGYAPRNLDAVGDSARMFESRMSADCPF